jgi:starch synthase
LIAIISRLASHKGLDLIKEALPRIIGENELSLVVLGTGESEYEEFFRKLEAEYPDKCRALIKYDRALAKKLYAAADILLMPSKSEPCGLSQMIACRYGAVPVVRKTGGLADSIKPYSKDESGNIIGNGFSFSDYSGESLSSAITSALSLYEKRDNFLELTKKIMSDDFSWSRSAKKYLEMYEF